MNEDFDKVSGHKIEPRKFDEVEHLKALLIRALAILSRDTPKSLIVEDIKRALEEV